MSPDQMTHDACRHYLTDLQKHHPEIDAELIDLARGALRARDVAKLSSISSAFDPVFHTGRDLSFLLQVEAFYKKNASFSDVRACLANARASFEDGERHCRLTNKRLDWYYTHPGRLDPDVREQLIKMERWIDSTLGRFDEFQEKIPELVRLTSGATENKPRRKAVPHRKLSGSYRCPPLAGHYIRALAAHFGYEAPTIYPFWGNRVEVVPKNWKTFRTIACEPTGSLPFQLAFDEYAKGRLLRKGINLRDQSLNQRLALRASLGEEIATLDLKNASNTIAFNTVAWLLPEAWFTYLAGLRSSTYRGKFGCGRYAMFSSMGNGATFTLETLIFASACHAVGAKVISVYGDDIILSADKVPALLKLMRFLGFIVNQEKSHVSGSYHESCGTHWYNGHLITPMYVQKEHLTNKRGLSHFVNTMCGIAIPDGDLWQFLLELTKFFELPLVPYNDNTASGVFILPVDAYSLGLLTSRKREYRWIAVYKAMVPKAPIVAVRSWRTLALWYHDAYRKVAPEVPWRFWDIIGPEPPEERVRSTVPSSSSRYERRWVCWVYPTRPLPDWLYCWSGAVSSLTKVKRQR